eukprot:TRINITY_DN10392_c0_g2_i4.p1 TRINITY_DN10392_c0_g2~~TRINITY_DN10392_c0_g2_i4.p1  ORF type:complete len:107 (+),score=11.19 TRINITY_DN10392_c0_g2_i4:327-647(+)
MPAFSAKQERCTLKLYSKVSLLFAMYLNCDVQLIAIVLALALMLLYACKCLLHEIASATYAGVTEGSEGVTALTGTEYSSGVEGDRSSYQCERLSGRDHFSDVHKM